MLAVFNYFQATGKSLIVALILISPKVIPKATKIPTRRALRKRCVRCLTPKVIVGLKIPIWTSCSYTWAHNRSDEGWIARAFFGRLDSVKNRRCDSIVAGVI